ncbi:MAG: anti-sigma factor domain-containing protein [Paenibacillaceae bacterium]
MHKGIVMDIAEQSILVMTPDGQFKQIAKQDRSCQLGEEISYVDIIKKPSMNWRAPRPFAIAAASVFCLMIVALLSILGEGGSTNKVAAYVTMDINPSIEVGIDENEHVIEVRGINDDGLELVKDLAYEGLTLEVFSDLIVQRIELGHYLDSGKANIIIASTVMNKDQKDYEIELAEKVKLKFIDAINKTHTAPKEQIIVTAITAPQEVRNEAVAQGVSTGKKAMQLLTRKNQKSTSDEELKEKPIQQMIIENGGIEEILPKERKVTKEEFKTMLKELHDEKKDRKNDDSNDDSNDDKDNNKKDNSSSKNDDHDQGNDKVKVKLDQQQEKNRRAERMREERQDEKEEAKKVREREKEQRKIVQRKEKEEQEKEQKKEQKKIENEIKQNKNEMKNDRDDRSDRNEQYDQDDQDEQDDQQEKDEDWSNRDG